MQTPHGLKQIIAAFGDPRKYIEPDGTLSPAWERTYITRIDLPEPLMLDLTAEDEEPMVSRVTCHVKLASLFSETLEMIHEAGLWARLRGYSGGFIFRKQRTGRKISLHSWGIAWDFDATHNAQGLDADRTKPGVQEPAMDMEIVKIFEGHGFVWGGRWEGEKRDPMHVQFAAGY